MEWFVGIFTLLGVMLGLGYSEYRNRQERKERFRVMTFEKRLQKHQEALSLCIRLSVLTTPRKLEEGEEGSRSLLDYMDETTNWFIDNCLYLDERSRLRMIEVLNYATKEGRKFLEVGDTPIDREQKLKLLVKELRKTMECLSQGVGAKYLPELMKSVTKEKSK